MIARRYVFVSLSSLAAVLCGCCLLHPSLPPCGASFGSYTVDLAFKSLDPDVLPLAFAPDANPADAKWQELAVYAPAKGTPGAAKKRDRMRATADGAAATLGLERELEGDGAIWVRVAFDSTIGLEDGVSTAFLARMTEPSGPEYAVEAAWDAAANGFTCRARVDGVVAGAPVTVPDQRELFLKLTSEGTSLAMAVALPSGVGYADMSADLPLHTAMVGAKSLYRAAVGVRDLGDAGSYYFAHFTARMSELPFFGDEASIGFGIGSALYQTHGLLTLVQYPMSEVADVIPQLEAALAAVESGALGAFGAAVEGGGLHVLTNASALGKSLARASTELSKASAKAHQLEQKGAPNPKPLTKRVKRAAKQLELAAAQLFGYQGTKPKKLGKTVSLGF